MRQLERRIDRLEEHCDPELVITALIEFIHPGDHAVVRTLQLTPGKPPAWKEAGHDQTDNAT